MREFLKREWGVLVAVLAMVAAAVYFYDFVAGVYVVIGTLAGVLLGLNLLAHRIRRLLNEADEEWEEKQFPAL